MTDRKLPRVPHSTRVGYSSAELLLSVLGMFSNICPIPAEKDLGIDMRGELLEDLVPNGLHFNVQCKGTEDVEINDKEISVPIKVTTVNYWFQQREPTFLIVVDRERQIFFWTYPYEQLKDRIEKIQNQDSITVHVSKKSQFNSAIQEFPEEMVDVIKNYENNNLENLAKTLLSLTTDKDITDIRDPLFSKVSGMHDNITKILNSVKVIEETYNYINSKREESIKKEIDKYTEVIIWLDHEPSVKRHLDSDSVYNDLGFGQDMTPRQIIDLAKKDLGIFSKDKSKENLDKLTESVSKLARLNVNLSFFLREVLYDLNPLGDYDWLVRDYL